MRKSFQKELSGLNTLAEKGLESFDVPEDVEKFNSHLDSYISHLSKIHGTYGSEHRRIYELQKSKQEIMQHLKRGLLCLDDVECKFNKEPKDREAHYDGSSGRFIYELENGTAIGATFGEIMADIDWDIYYCLDKTTTPRNLFKKYLVERAKHDLQGLLNKQIIINEMKVEDTSHGKREAYKIRQKELVSGVSAKRSGFIAEKTVKSMFRKMVYDQDVDFRIIEADIFQDIEQKIDFIIQITSKRRGVDVVTNRELRNIGIQFTTNVPALRYKMFQVNSAKDEMSSEERIDDIIVVAFPIDTIKNAYMKWKSAGSPSGGPCQFMDRDSAKQLFFGILYEILPFVEIQKYWNEAKNYFIESNNSVASPETMNMTEGLKLSQLTLNVNDLGNFEKDILTIAEAIYNKININGRTYDPYEGDMLCADITDNFLKYIGRQGMRARRIDRIYEIQDPTGAYNDNFGHVYFIIDSGEEHILVDPTYLQFVNKEKRKALPPVLILRYKNDQELRQEISKVPISTKMAVPFYLGFDSPEARAFFVDSKYTVLSEERARLDD